MFLFVSIINIGLTFVSIILLNFVATKKNAMLSPNKEKQIMNETNMNELQARCFMATYRSL